MVLCAKDNLTVLSLNFECVLHGRLLDFVVCGFMFFSGAL